MSARDLLNNLAMRAPLSMRALLLFFARQIPDDLLDAVHNRVSKIALAALSNDAKDVGELTIDFLISAGVRGDHLKMILTDEDRLAYDRNQAR